MPLIISSSVLQVSNVCQAFHNPLPTVRGTMHSAMGPMGLPYGDDANQGHYCGEDNIADSYWIPRV
jgi:hypothetical protein